MGDPSDCPRKLSETWGEIRDTLEADKKAAMPA